MLIDSGSAQSSQSGTVRRSEAPRGRNAARKDVPVDAVFDIETETWTRFLCGGVLFADGSYQAFDWHSEQAFVDLLLSHEGTLWSHNGGAFDLKWLLDHAIARGLKVDPMAAGSRIVRMKVGKLYCYDSKAVTKISLKELTQGMGVEKKETGIDCTCGERCGGYCAFKRTMPKAQLRKVLEYMEADVRSLWCALQRVKEFCAVNDLDFGATVGGSAWSCAKRWLELPGADLTRSHHTFARRGYFGGRVQLFRPLAAHGWEADVNSMYPSRLSGFPLPVGKHGRRTGQLARLAYSSGSPGIFKARVRVPQMHLPPLPVRCKGRIAYPTGSFSGTWAAPELRYAESVGCKVRVEEGLVWSGERVIFKEWVDKLFELRAGAPGGKKSPIGTFLKFYLNSLTGKLGSRPEHEKMVINPTQEEFAAMLAEKDPRRKWRRFDPPKKDDAGLIFVKDVYHLDPCAHVEWAAYLTAEARVEWHRQATSNEEGFDAVYGDTDSLFSLARRENVVPGDDCGRWHDEGEFQNFRGVAPKIYSFERAGKKKVRAKGLRLPRYEEGKEYFPEKAAQALRMIAGEERNEWSSVVGFRRGARAAHFFVRDDELTGKKSSRRVKQGYGDRILEPGHEVTRAPKIGELQNA